MLTFNVNRLDPKSPLDLDLSVFNDDGKVHQGNGNMELQSIDELLQSLGDDSLLNMGQNPASPPDYVPMTPPEQHSEDPHPDAMAVDVAAPPAVKQEMPPTVVAGPTHVARPGITREVSPPRVAEVPQVVPSVAPQVAMHTLQHLAPQPQLLASQHQVSAGHPAVLQSLPHAPPVHPNGYAHTVMLPPGYPHGVVPVYTVGRPEQLVKKARRMQKNRESAAVSRQKKKEHVETLERSVQALVVDKENLQKRVTELEGENKSLRDEVTELRNQLGSAAPRPKTGVLTSSVKLMACLLCVGLVTVSQGPASVSREVVPLRSSTTGRTLKSFDAPILTSPSTRKTRGDVQDRPSKTKQRDDEATLKHQRWIARHLNFSATRRDKGDASDTGTDLVAVNVQEMSEDRGPPILRLGTSYGPALFESVQQRPDHSYVFCTEMQMVAAQQLAPDGVPRMSLIMPTPDTVAAATPAKNGSLPAVSLLQVDCAVEDSKFVTVGFRNGTVTA